MAPPVVPAAGTELDRDTTARLAGQFDDWVATIASQLVDLENEAQASADDAQRADIAAAFTLWRAVSERAAEWDGAGQASTQRRAQVLAAAWTPLSSDTGEVVAASLADGCTFLDALVTRLTTDVGAAQAQTVAAASAWMTLDDDLRHATHAANRLGQEVRHVSELAAEAVTQPRAIAPPADLVARASDVRARLDAGEREREQLLARLDAATGTLAELDRQEAAVRTLAATCRAKIAGAPNLAVPSVAAIGAPPDDVRDRPWPAVQAAATAWLRLAERTGAALDEAARRFQAPLVRRDELRGLLQAFRDKADSAGLSEHEALDPRYTAARDTLWSAPCDLARAETLVDEYIRTLNTMMHGVN